MSLPGTPIVRPNSPIAASIESPSGYGSTTMGTCAPTATPGGEGAMYVRVPTSTPDEELQQASATSLTPATVTKDPRERGTSPTDVKDVEGMLKQTLIDPKKKLFSSDADLESGLSDGEKKELVKVVDDELPPVRWIILVVIPVFMGYASLFSLQHKVKAEYGIADDGSTASRAFGAAVSFLYLGNLIFRFAHNFVFFASHRVGV